MNRMLRWALPERSDEAMGDLLDLFDRRAAKIGRTRARLRLAVDLLSLIALGLRHRGRQVVGAFPRSVGALLIGLPGDLRSAARVLRKSPSFSLAAILILALGIGANTAVFSFVNAILLKPIAPERAGVVGVYARSTEQPGGYRGFSYEDYRHIRAAGGPFADVMAYTVTLAGITEGDDTRRTSGVIATSNYFSVLDTRLAIGREFTGEEERPGSDIRVAIITFEYWRRLGGTAATLGTTVRLNGVDYTVVGVAPERFTGTTALLTPEFWVPTGVYERMADDLFREQREERLADPRTRGLMLAGRLTPGLGVDDASPLLGALSTRMAEIDPAANSKHALVVQKLSRVNISQQPATDNGPTAVSALLMGAASLVLLLACLNLANMLLARGTARRREIAVRVAVGGARLRIVRQLLIESLVLAAIGGAAGLVLALFGLELLIGSARAALPVALSLDVSPDVRVLAATVTFCVISTVIGGLGPAWRASQPDLLSDLKDQPALASGLRRFSVRNALVAAQVTVCLALLVSAGLFVRGAIEAADADPGFATDRNIVLGVDSGIAGYAESHSRSTMRRLMERLRAIPGVASASFGSIMPFGDENDGRGVLRDGAAADAPPAGATYTIVGADYFQTLGVPILQGRGFSATEESTGGAPVAVIDRALAEKLFRDESPVGRMIRFERAAERNRVMEIIGVAGPVRDSVSDLTPSPHVYVPYGQAFSSGQYVHVRMKDGASPAAFVDIVRQTVNQIDPDLPILRLKTLEDFRRGSLQVWVFAAAARVFSTFGIAALILAVAGVYGMKAYVVSRRTREIAIRLALGATPRGVLWMIVGEGLVLTSVGLGVGLALAAGIGQVLGAMLYGVSATDPLVFGGAIGVLGIAALVASYLPARRATKLAFSAALRAE